MEDQIKKRLSRRSIWMRALFMVFFALAFAIAELLTWVVVVIQFVIVLFTGAANDRLLQLGNNLSAYIYRVLKYQTFNTESQPFPFDNTPPATVGATPSTEDPDAPARDRHPDDDDP